MLKHLLSLVLSLCLLANVNLGCATMSLVQQQGATASISVQAHGVMAMGGCGDHAPAKGQSKAPNSHQASACKAFCGSIMVQPSLVMPYTYFMQQAETDLETATPSWDSSVDPPRPRLVTHTNTETQIQI